MHISLNELTLTSYKAALGVGASVGAAEDLAQAAAWLGLRGLHPVGMIVHAVESIDIGRSVYGSVRLDKACAKWGADGSGVALSAILLGGAPAALYTSMAVSDPRSTLYLNDLDAPLLQLPHFSRLAQKYELTCTIEWSCRRIKRNAACSGGKVNISHDVCEQEAAGRFDMEVRGQAADNDDAGPLQLLDSTEAQYIYDQGYDVDAEEWGRLGRYADQIMVDATEQSRASGAGAGLRDND